MNTRPFSKAEWDAAPMDAKPIVVAGSGAGKPVRIICTDGDDPVYPIAGYRCGELQTWAFNGAFDVNQTKGLMDLRFVSAREFTDAEVSEFARIAFLWADLEATFAISCRERALITYALQQIELAKAGRA